MDLPSTVTSSNGNVNSTSERNVEMKVCGEGNMDRNYSRFLRDYETTGKDYNLVGMAGHRGKYNFEGHARDAFWERTGEMRMRQKKYVCCRDDNRQKFVYQIRFR